MKQIKETKHYRAHCYSETGVKRQCFLPIGDPLPPTIEGYSPWCKGAGAMSPSVLAATRARNQILFAGVPKTPEQKAKMRLRKLGVPKTEEHKLNMGISQRARLAKKAAA
jgi:hypothetical protein